MDPEERRNKFMALASTLFGIFSLCAGLIPACGGAASIVGILLGVFGMKSENRKIAILGIVLSGLGLIISIVYAIMLLTNKK
jgi:Mn2+/Fe2+ NRAMP family transporter